MEMTSKLRALMIFNHVMMVIGLLCASWYWLALSFVGLIVFGKIGGEIGLHRYLSHKSFTTAWWKERVMLGLSVFLCIGSPVLWVGIHRKHHAKSDTLHDPLIPENRWRIWRKWNPMHIEPKYYVDLLRIDDIKFIHKHYFTLLCGTYVILALVDWRIPVFLISISSVLNFHSVNMVNSITHESGYRNFDTKDKSTNHTLVNYLTLGIGLHNNHHADPKNWNNKVKEHEVDPIGWFIERFLIHTPAAKENR